MNRLTNNSKYNVFYTSVLRKKVLEYSDVKTVIQVSNTCKSFKDDKIKIYKFLYYNYHSFFTLNLIKTERTLYQLDINKSYHYYQISFLIFKILINKIISQNKYKARYIIGLTDLYFTYTEYPNFKPWINFYINFLNKNIKTIKKNNKINTWNNILYLRTSMRSRPQIKYNQSLDMFIIPDGFFKL